MYRVCDVFLSDTAMKNHKIFSTVSDVVKWSALCMQVTLMYAMVIHDIQKRKGT